MESTVMKYKNQLHYVGQFGEHFTGGYWTLRTFQGRTQKMICFDVSWLGLLMLA